MIKTTGRKFGISATVATVVVVAVAVVGLLAQKCTKDFENIVIANTQQRLLTIAKLQADNIMGRVIEHQAKLQMLAGNLRTIKRGSHLEEFGQFNAPENGFNTNLLY